MLEAKQEREMSFEITGHKAGLEGSFIRTTAESATEALRMARQWAGQGIQGITITNPKGESYDLDAFDIDRQHQGRALGCRPGLTGQKRHGFRVIAVNRECYHCRRVVHQFESSVDRTGQQENDPDYHHR
jgi:hypothetical protein